MSDSEQAGFIARAAALRQSTPRAEDLIQLPDVAAAIAVGLRLTACEAGRILVDDLQTGVAAYVALFRGYYGGLIRPISDYRMSAQPGDFNDGRKHWPSERDNVLGGLPLALFMGFALGDHSHPDSRKAGALMMLRTDCNRCFIEPLLAHLQANTTTSLPPIESLQLVSESAPVASPPPASEKLDDTRRRAVLMLRKLEGSETKSARAKVAAAYSKNIRTVSKWVAIVEKEEAAAKREGVFDSQLQGLAATRTGN